MAPIKDGPRGRCTSCKRDFALNLDGTLHAHRRLGIGCLGSHRAPKAANSK